MKTNPGKCILRGYSPEWRVLSKLSVQPWCLVALQAGIHPSFLSIKQLGVLLPVADLAWLDAPTPHPLLARILRPERCHNF